MNAITRSFTGRKRIRKSFGRIPEVAPMPNLIDVQRASYEAFLQMDVAADNRTNTGLQEVFKSVFPIDDFAGRGRLEFVYYELEEPKYDVEECIQRGMTYAAPLKVILRLIVWDVDEDTGARSIRDIKEQPVYMGDMPLMTDNGTFIINGTERVIVSQMHRSPGVFFDHDKGKTHSLGQVPVRRPGHPVSRLLAGFRVRQQGPGLRPHRPQAEAAGHHAAVRAGKRRTPSSCAPRARPRARRSSPAKSAAWTRKRSSPASTARWCSTAPPKGWARPFDPDGVPRHEAAGAAGRRRDRRGGGRGRSQADRPRRRARIAEKTKEVLVGRADLLGRFVAEDLVNAETGEIFAEAGEELAEARLAALEDAGIDRLPTLAVDQSNGPWIRNTLAVDKNTNRDDALIDIYRVMRPGEPPTPETAEALFRGLFFDPRPLRPVGGRPGEDEHAARLRATCRTRVRVLRKEDLLRTVKIAVRPEGRPRPDRRHRQPRQPPRALGRRADGEPVPRRPAAHGAGDPRAHGLGRHRHRDAARPDQRQAGGGGGARVLRLRRSFASSWTRPTRCPR